MVRSSSLISPPNEPDDGVVSIPDSESDVESEPSSLMVIESSSNKTRRNRAHGRAREDTLASLEQRMRKARHKPNPWKCSICCYDFITLEILQNHVKENHHEYTYKCERCPYFSKQGSYMQTHEQSHDKMKRKHKNPGVHKCDLCNVWLVTLHFSRHLRGYHGE